jgi:hypothetical protein
MARVDAFYLDDPTSGSRRMVHYLGTPEKQIADQLVFSQRPGG